MKSWSKDSIRADIQASFVVFLIALPLGLGVATASGYPPIAGIISGIIGGLIVGFLSGSPLQVSGAAAGLSIVCLQFVQDYGLAQMTFIVFLAGLFQIIGALFRIGTWFQSVSTSVIYGMLAGIGLLIFSNQFHVMLDLKAPGSGLINLTEIPFKLYELIFSSTLSLDAFICGVIALTVLYAWPRFARPSWSLWMPGSLLAVLVASVSAWVLGLQINFVKIPENIFQNMKVGFDFSVISNVLVLTFCALKLAFIASTESLLCASALDQIHEGQKTDYNRELMAQGVGNTLCGIFGGLPMTGVIVRSSANVMSGAKTRLSAILHGAWLLLFVLYFPQVISLIPASALAALLVFTGLKLINFEMMHKIHQQSLWEFFIFSITMITVFSYDLLWGVVLGIGLGSLKAIPSLSLNKSSIQSKEKN